jgi:hypothetical protein
MVANFGIRRRAEEKIENRSFVVLDYLKLDLGSCSATAVSIREIVGRV